ncbi:ATP synthase F1 subunit delta [bacterium]|nr:ATP synthase F1 subunit delta [bacterium]
MRIARRYAEAFLETASEEDLANLLDAVERLKKGKTLFYLSLPSFGIQQKEEFLLSFLPSLSENTRRFLFLLLSKRRISLLPEIGEELIRLKREKEGIALALVRSPIPLLSEERELLRKILENKFAKRIILEEEIDPSLIGGFTVEVEGNMIDASLKGFLIRLREKIISRGESRWA